MSRLPDHIRRAANDPTGDQRSRLRSALKAYFNRNSEPLMELLDEDLDYRVEPAGQPHSGKHQGPVGFLEVLGLLVNESWPPSTSGPLGALVVSSIKPNSAIAYVGIIGDTASQRHVIRFTFGPAGRIVKIVHFIGNPSYPNGDQPAD